METVSWLIFLSVLTSSVLLFGAVHAYAYTLAILGILLASLLLLLCGIQKSPGGRILVIRLPSRGPESPHPAPVVKIDAAAIITDV